MAAPNPAAEWAKALPLFLCSVAAGGDGRSAGDNHQVLLNKALAFLRDCARESGWKHAGVACSFDCIRLTIQMGQIGASLDDSSNHDLLSTTVSSAVHVMKSSLGAVTGRCEASTVIAAQKALLCLLGRSAHAMKLFAGREEHDGTGVLLSMLTGTGTGTGTGTAASASSSRASSAPGGAGGDVATRRSSLPLSVLHSTARILHFMQIKHTALLQSHLPNAQLLPVMLQLLARCLAMPENGSCVAPAAVPPASVVQPGPRSLTVLEVLRFVYATLAAAEEAAVRVLAERDDCPLLCVLRYILLQLPSRHRTAFEYQLQAVQVLMLLPTDLVLTGMCNDGCASGNGGDSGCGAASVGIVPVLLYILHVQLETVWELDTDAALGGARAQAAAAGMSEAEAAVQSVLVMGYNSERTTVLLMPILGVLVHLCSCDTSDAAAAATAVKVKKYLKLSVFGDVSRSPTVRQEQLQEQEQLSVRGKLITLMTCLNTYLKRSGGELLLALCDGDENEFVARTGYGNAIGLLQAKQGFAMPTRR